MHFHTVDSNLTQACGNSLNLSATQLEAPIFKTAVWGIEATAETNDTDTDRQFKIVRAHLCC